MSWYDGPLLIIIGSPRSTRVPQSGKKGCARLAIASAQVRLARQANKAHFIALPKLALTTADKRPCPIARYRATVTRDPKLETDIADALGCSRHSRRTSGRGNPQRGGPDRDGAAALYQRSLCGRLAAGHHARDPRSDRSVHIRAEQPARPRQGLSDRKLLLFLLFPRAYPLRRQHSARRHRPRRRQGPLRVLRGSARVEVSRRSDQSYSPRPRERRKRGKTHSVPLSRLVWRQDSRVRAQRFIQSEAAGRRSRAGRGLSRTGLRRLRDPLLP